MSLDLLYLDQRVVTPCLAPYERLEIEQAVTLLNTIARKKMNLAGHLSDEEAKVCVVVIETLRGLRKKAVKFGVEQAGAIVKDSTTLSQARQRLAHYAESPELS